MKSKKHKETKKKIEHFDQIEETKKKALSNAKNCLCDHIPAPMSLCFIILNNKRSFIVFTVLGGSMFDVSYARHGFGSFRFRLFNVWCNRLIVMSPTSQNRYQSLFSFYNISSYICHHSWSFFHLKITRLFPSLFFTLCFLLWMNDINLSIFF